MYGEKYEIGDRVMIRGSTIGTSLPRYLEGSPMTIKGFTKNGRALCDYDGKEPFRVPLWMLEKLNGGEVET